jgi:hypothetical protein
MANSMIGGVLDNNVWYVNFEALNHMTIHGEWFRNTWDLKTPRFVETGDDTTHPITQIGKVPLSMQDGQTKYYMSNHNKKIGLCRPDGGIRFTCDIQP